MQAHWEPTGSDLAPLRARKQERKRQELLAVALGLRLGVKDTLLWKPIKLLACPQISNSPLGRRSALKDGPEKQCNYEKVHNFKVSTKQIHGCKCNINYALLYTANYLAIPVLSELSRPTTPN